MKLLVTGGCGFIGSAVIRRGLAAGISIINVDKLTYAANPANLPGAAENPLYAFEKADIADGAAMASLFERHQPDAVMHLAAESHVDRSIDGPEDFIQTNIVGTFRLLEAARKYWSLLPGARKDAFRFHHVSTDEVFGSLGAEGRFTETSPYAPNSPYSATKAGSDHLVRAWGETFGLPIVISNTSNNYGPCQFPEKLIPLTILNALAGQPLPVYGRGENVRDWLYVEDHAKALLCVLEKGTLGETYNIGGNSEARNIDIVRKLAALMDEARPAGAPHERLITMVADRPGHDARYAIDGSYIEKTLGFVPETGLEEGLRRTVDWYLGHADWWRPLQAIAATRRGVM